ncbi:hypothetical protein GCM10023340_20750 [Nocardioides marinquilinus]|uniref:Proteinase inhibitor I42 chagasin domain-containing protein n=1 Tax=Nocardioides marinquilinus TaxID=1210400 RepID=A0ABP9PN15_9ACTN
MPPVRPLVALGVGLLVVCLAWSALALPGLRDRPALTSHGLVGELVAVGRFEPGDLRLEVVPTRRVEVGPDGCVVSTRRTLGAGFQWVVADGGRTVERVAVTDRYFRPSAGRHSVVLVERHGPHDLEVSRAVAVSC